MGSRVTQLTARKPERDRPNGQVPGEIKTRILAAALELFAERGFNATTTAEIARQAGVAEKTIFANFRSKDALFEKTLTPATVDLLIPDLTEVGADVFEEPNNLREFLDRLFRNRLAVVRKHPAKFKMIVQELLLRPERARRYLSNLDKGFHLSVEKVFRRLQRQGELRKMPMSQLHRVTVSAILGYAIPRILIWPDGKWDDEAEIAATVDILARGLSRSCGAEDPVRRRQRSR